MKPARPVTAVALPRHPEEVALLEGIVEHPGDDARFLILADWLDERADPRGELLRLHRRLLATCSEPAEHPERAVWQARVVELLAGGVRPCVPRRTASLGGSSVEFAWCPPGTFLMGSPPEEPERSGDETQHRVTLTQGFWMGVTPVTQAQWQAVTGGNPSHFQGDNLPVEQVSWGDCQEFCTKVGAKVGRRFRLPTEAEWEYACRAGTTTPFHFGATIGTDQANYDGNYTYGKGKKGKYRKQTMPVGSFPANAWGLYDVHGNVWEWCQDRYGRYSKRVIKDPKGSHNGAAHVVRGGSWVSGPRRCRAAGRSRLAPGGRNDRLGCRVVLCLD